MTSTRYRCCLDAACSRINTRTTNKHENRRGCSLVKDVCLPLLKLMVWGVTVRNNDEQQPPCSVTLNSETGMIVPAIKSNAITAVRITYDGSR